MQNNTIFNTILKNKNNHYIHALEVETTYEIENCIECIWFEFQETATIKELKDFFNSMEIYYYEVDENDKQIENEENENEIYNFDIDQFIENNLN
jgi:dihydroorotase